MCPFLKSYINQNEAQNATDYSPYVDKQYNNYINDINNCVYTNNSLVNGKSIESTQPFINIARHFHLISEMSVNDLATLGNSMGFAPTLDNPKAAKYQPAFAAFANTASASGNGLSNNRVFAAASDNQIAAGAQN